MFTEHDSSSWDTMTNATPVVENTKKPCVDVTVNNNNTFYSIAFADGVSVNIIQGNGQDAQQEIDVVFPQEITPHYSATWDGSAYQASMIYNNGCSPAMISNVKESVDDRTHITAYKDGTVTMHSVEDFEDNFQRTEVLFGASKTIIVHRQDEGAKDIMLIKHVTANTEEIVRFTNAKIDVDYKRKLTA
jgi:hypothetical protein